MQKYQKVHSEEINDNNNNTGNELKIKGNIDINNQNEIIDLEKNIESKGNNKGNDSNKKYQEIFQNNFEDKKPLRLGESYAFLYDKNGDPYITIGPHCKFYIIIEIFKR